MYLTYLIKTDCPLLSVTYGLTIGDLDVLMFQTCQVKTHHTLWCLVLRIFFRCAILCNHDFSQAILMSLLVLQTCLMKTYHSVLSSKIYLLHVVSGVSPVHVLSKNDLFQHVLIFSM